MDTADNDQTVSSAADLIDGAELASRLEQLIADVGTLMSDFENAVPQAASAADPSAAAGALESQEAETAQARQQVADLIALLAETRAQTENSIDGAADACSNLLEQAQDQVQGVVDAVEGLVSGLDDAYEELDAAAGETSAQIDSALGAGREAYEQHAQIVGPDTVAVLERQLLESFQDKIQQADAAFARNLQGLRQEANGALDEVSEILNQAAEQLVSMVESVIRDSQGERGTTQAAADVVQAVTEPIRREIERVADLASSVGISL